MMIVMTLLTGFVYPVVITVVAQTVFRDKANGSLIVVDGQAIGSHLIGQSFTRPEYFHPRPSAAGPGGYDPTASGGTNLGPTSAKLHDDISARIVRYCVENGIPFEAGMPKTAIPADAVTASASGLDPHISPRNAELQAGRVAKARGISIKQVQDTVALFTSRRTLGVLGEPAVNVLELNLALDERFRGK